MFDALAAVRFAGGRRSGYGGNRARHDRGKLRYLSDLTDQEWTLIEPMIPEAKPGGRASLRSELEKQSKFP